jgi:hypothetical protein
MTKWEIIRFIWIATIAIAFAATIQATSKGVTVSLSIIYFAIWGTMVWYIALKDYIHALTMGLLF